MVTASEICLWLMNVNRLMYQKYLIDSNDAGWDEDDINSFYSIGLSPFEFVEWYAEKYDLMSIDSVRFSSS